MSISFIIAIASTVIAIFALIVAFYRNALMAKQMRLNSAISIVNWLESVRPSRHILYGMLQQKKNIQDWSDEEKNAANEVTRKFDILGLLDNLGYTDERFVDRFYAIPAKELWDICNEWVTEERKTRGNHHLWEFEQLAHRVRKVKGNHPATNKMKKWKRRPRLA